MRATINAASTSEGFERYPLTVMAVLDTAIYRGTVLEQMAGSVAGHDGVDVCATSQSIGRLV